MVAPRVLLYMLTEDSGNHSHATWTALLKQMCRIVDGSCDTGPETFVVEPPEQSVSKVMSGTGWREKASHPRMVEFWRTIAEQLASEKVVVFHVDGEVPWSKRKDSANVAGVEQIARRRLRDTLEDVLEYSPEEIAARMQLFVPVHPFREIEGWLFHNFDELRRICARRRLPVPACVEQWETQVETLELEEEERPKERMPFKAEHNRDLAENAFPAEMLYLLGSSFHEAVEALRRCAPLRHALKSTYAAERWETDSR